MRRDGPRAATGEDRKARREHEETTAARGRTAAGAGREARVRVVRRRERDMVRGEDDG